MTFWITISPYSFMKKQDKNLGTRASCPPKNIRKRIRGLFITIWKKGFYPGHPKILAIRIQTKLKSKKNKERKVNY